MIRKNILAIVLAVVLFSCLIFGGSFSTVAQSQKQAVEPTNKAVDSSFVNMLNLNRIYNEDFCDQTLLVEEVAIGLKDCAVEGYVSESAVEAFIYAMYSLNVDAQDASCNAQEKVEGYIPLPSRGYTDYSHKAISEENGNDGTYTVYSEITVDCHDGNPETYLCETLFCVCAESPFGYNIVYSNIIE